MSTRLKSAGKFLMTRFWGGVERGVSVQITDPNNSRYMGNTGFIQLNRDEALELAYSLLAFGLEKEEEEDCESR